MKNNSSACSEIFLEYIFLREMTENNGIKVTVYFNV